MNAPLPPFNLVSRCLKCGMKGGGEGFSVPAAHVHLAAPDSFPVEYHKAYAHCSLSLEEEHLHRTCPRCKFEWAEACVNPEGGAG